jgi:hypothetical protein
MGWWKVQGTETTIGDAVLDALGDATSSIVASYLTAFGRRPTKAEWEALLTATLGGGGADASVVEDGTVTVVRVE